MEIKGVTHPVPTEYAKRIYNENKTVFVGKSHLGKVKKGDKFVIYESHGAKAYTGWAIIKSVHIMKTNQIIRNFGNKLMITKSELAKYARNRKEMNIIEFENFERFRNPVKPKRFVIVSGKYIYKDEYQMILENKD